MVAPFVGAWIEIFYGYDGDIKIIPVAPFVGAWIEIAAIADVLDAYASHPLWVRGLKSSGLCPACMLIFVAPFVGAWIEIFDDVIISHVRENSS